MAGPRTVCEGVLHAEISRAGGLGQAEAAVGVGGQETQPGCSTWLADQAYITVHEQRVGVEQSRVSKPRSDQGVGLPPGLSAARPEPTPCSHCEVTFSEMNRCVWEQHEKVHTLVNHIQKD